MSALVFLGLRGYDQAMLPMGYQDVDLTKRLATVGKAIAVHSADETGNVLSNVMEEVVKKKAPSARDRGQRFERRARAQEHTLGDHERYQYGALREKP